jgi:hypothetical protein
MEAMIVAVGTGAAAGGGAAGFAVDAGIGGCVGSIAILVPMVRKATWSIYHLQYGRNA